MSIRAHFAPMCANAEAIAIVSVVLPAPPFEVQTLMTFDIQTLPYVFASITTNTAHSRHTVFTHPTAHTRHTPSATKALNTTIAPRTRSTLVTMNAA
ncbi:hypothetical protein OCEANICA350_20029 [Oceanicaulis sp. 350]|nr:hypothetical protein OCEANICA350_20029 [Oceanicaulis sp. 350]